MREVPRRARVTANANEFLIEMRREVGDGGEMLGFLGAGLDQVLALARESGPRDSWTKR